MLQIAVEGKHYHLLNGCVSDSNKGNFVVSEVSKACSTIIIKQILAAIKERFANTQQNILIARGF